MVELILFVIVVTLGIYAYETRQRLVAVDLVFKRMHTTLQAAIEDDRVRLTKLEGNKK